MTRLADLHPEWRRVYVGHDKTADRGGIPTDDWELGFDCPACGRPRRVFIRIGLGEPDAAKQRWRCRPMPPDGTDWPNKVTIIPSIQMRGHGREDRPCSWHGSIINGEIVPS